MNAASPPGLFPEAAHADAAVRDEFRRRVEEALEGFDWLGAPSLPEGIEAWQLIGTGTPTEVGIGFGDDGPAPRIAPEGDDTVPVASARALATGPGRTLEISGLRHASACQHEGVLDAAREILAEA